MNVRTIFSASAAAALLVVGPGWALAGPSAHVTGDVTGSADAVAAEDGLHGAADAAGSIDAGIDVGELPEASAPQAPEAPEVSAPDAPEVSAPEAPEVNAPEAPEPPQGEGDGDVSGGGDGPEAPAAPELPEVSLPQPASVQPQGPGKGPGKPALDKGSSEGDGSARAEGSVSLSGSVSGGNPPEATYDADGHGLVEAAGQTIETP